MLSEGIGLCGRVCSGDGAWKLTMRNTARPKAIKISVRSFREDNKVFPYKKRGIAKPQTARFHDAADLSCAFIQCANDCLDMRLRCSYTSDTFDCIGSRSGLDANRLPSHMSNNYVHRNTSPDVLLTT